MFRSSLSSLRYPAPLDKFAGSEFGRLKVARRERAMDGAHQSPGFALRAARSCYARKARAHILVRPLAGAFVHWTKDLIRFTLHGPPYPGKLSFIDVMTMNPDNSPAPPLETKSQRMFFALWPSLELSRELYSVAGRVLEGDARRVLPENIHLTLAFLGSVKAPFRQCAEQVAATIRGGSFTLTLEQIGCWPKPGILWIGPRHTPEPLSRLVRELNAGLVACGYAPEERSYAAHLTLARKLHRCNRNLLIDPLIWEVRRFCLVQSYTHAEGARYETVRSWELNSSEP